VDPGVKAILGMSLVLDTGAVSSMLKQFQLLFLIQKTHTRCFLEDSHISLISGHVGRNLLVVV